MNWKKQTSIGIKIIVIAGAYWFLVKKLIAFDGWQQLRSNFFEEPLRFAQFLFPVVVLMAVNLSIRSLIWKYLVGNIEKISFKRAFRAILLGITGASVTPAKLGDWAGKAVVLSPAFRKKGFFIAAFGHLIQNITMIAPGIVAFFYFARNHTDFLSLSSQWSYAILWLIEGGILIFTLVLPFAVKWLRTFRFPWKINGMLDLISEYRQAVYFKIVVLNLLKNTLIYFQLFILLRLFGIPISLLQALVIIPTFYLSLTFVPGLVFADMGVIGAFGIMIIGAVFSNDGAIALATMSIWIINVGVPLVLGSLLVALYKNRGKRLSRLHAKV